jgi:hypothetical protein
MEETPEEQKKKENYTKFLYLQMLHGLARCHTETSQLKTCVGDTI